MKSGEASRTAEYQALFRAVESVRRPVASRLFTDPFAAHFLRPKLRQWVRLASLPFGHPLVRAYADAYRPGVMSSGIARTRLIDDMLLAAVKEGVRQVVILGAGFDCRAFRIPELSACRVVEIDHPDTQAAKKERLGAIIPSLPGNVTFMPADLTVDDLAAVLGTTGLKPGERMFVVWEGVTHYIGEKAVDATLRILAHASAPGSRVVFTYIHGGLIDGTMRFHGGEAMRHVAGAGEPWIWGMYPERLTGYLAERGWTLVEDMSADEYRTRYWGEAGRRMKGFSFYRAALAQKGNR